MSPSRWASLTHRSSRIFEDSSTEWSSCHVGKRRKSVAWHWIVCRTDVPAWFRNGLGSGALPATAPKPFARLQGLLYGSSFTCAFADIGDARHRTSREYCYSWSLRTFENDTLKHAWGSRLRFGSFSFCGFWIVFGKFLDGFKMVFRACLDGV